MDLTTNVDTDHLELALGMLEDQTDMSPDERAAVEQLRIALAETRKQQREIRWAHPELPLPGELAPLMAGERLAATG